MSDGLGRWLIPPARCWLSGTTVSVFHPNAHTQTKCHFRSIFARSCKQRARFGHFWHPFGFAVYTCAVLDCCHSLGHAQWGRLVVLDPSCCQWNIFQMDTWVLLAALNFLHWICWALPFLILVNILIRVCMLSFFYSLDFPICSMSCWNTEAGKAMIYVFTTRGQIKRWGCNFVNFFRCAAFWLKKKKC